MRAGYCDAIVRKQLGAFSMQVFVGRHVAARADAVQPSGDAGVGIEAPSERARLQVEHRPPIGRIHHAAAIDMVFIQRLAHFRMREEIGVGRVAVAL